MMSLTTSNTQQEGNHFHRSMDQHINHHQQVKPRNNLPREDRQQLHKKRRSSNGYHASFPDSRGPPPRPYVQNTGYSHDQPNYLPTELVNYQNMQLPFQQLPQYGGIGTPLNSYSAPNLPLGNPSLLNENLFNTFQLPNPQMQQQQQPPHQNHLPQPHLQHHISPLGVDIGSIPNLTQLLAQSNETSQLHGQAMNRQIVLEQLKAQELQQQQQLLKMFPTKKEENTTPTSSNEKKLNHHDILRQHNEEYKMKQMKKAAVHQASSRYGHYSPQDSAHFNFIVPSLPSYLLDGTTETKPQESKEEQQ